MLQPLDESLRSVVINCMCQLGQASLNDTVKVLFQIRLAFKSVDVD